MKSPSFVEVDDEPLHKEEYKSDIIRVYRALLEPGESTEFHRHCKNTVYITMKGGRIAAQRMKGTPPCPMILPKNLSVRKRLLLFFEKILYRYLTLEKGFLFYMPSQRSPVIHRAIASSGNNEIMELLGIEILSPVGGGYNSSNHPGKRVMDNRDIAVFRLSLKPNQIFNEPCFKEKKFLLVTSGDVEITGEQKVISLSAGNYYWVDDGSIRMIHNHNPGNIYIILIVVKKP